ncbi:MAG TPA: hypothetical protein VH326_07930 [Sphingomonas sp.]|nr:hypothetical protein [Sphingomonas sp.]
MLQQGDIVRIAMALHDLPATRKSATTSRIKNFLKLDFPSITAVGTGDRADYTAVHAVQLLIGFELLRFRMPPNVIVAVVNSSWPTIAGAFGDAARTLRAQGAGQEPGGERTLLSVDSRALHETGKTVTPRGLKSSVEVVKATALATAIGSAPGGFRSGLIIDPTFMLERVLEALPKLRRPMEGDVLLREIARWKSKTVAVANDAD